MPQSTPSASANTKIRMVRPLEESAEQPGPGTVLTNRTLIIASNRGPVTFTQESDGSFTTRKGSGGVVTAVSALARDRQPIWVAAAMNDGDRARAAQAKAQGEALISPPGDASEFRLQFVVP